MRMLRIVFFIASVYGQSDVYWGSYELNIPGGSGSGNAVQDLKLPENAPEFFQFANFNSQPFAAPQFTPVAQSAPQEAPRPAQQAVLRPAPRPAPQVRPAPQPQQLRVFQSQPTNRQQQRQRPAQIRKPDQQPAPRPAQPAVQRPAPQPAPHVTPAPQPQQLRVIQSQPANRQQQRKRPAQISQPAERRKPTQIRQSAPHPSPVKQQAVQAVQPTQRFENFAARTQERRPSPAIQAQPPIKENEVDTENAKDEAVVDVSDLSRFQLYQLRQTLKLQKESQKVEASDLAEIITLKSEDIQEKTAPSLKVVPKRTRTGIRRKAVRRKLVRTIA